MKILIIGVDYAIKSYMDLHAKILNEDHNVFLLSIESIIPNFERRSFKTLINDIKKCSNISVGKSPTYSLKSDVFIFNNVLECY